jgi:hypothetical protein
MKKLIIFMFLLFEFTQVKAQFNNHFYISLNYPSSVFKFADGTSITGKAKISPYFGFAFDAPINTKFKWASGLFMMIKNQDRYNLGELDLKQQFLSIPFFIKYLPFSNIEFHNGITANYLIYSSVNFHGEFSRDISMSYFSRVLFKYKKYKPFVEASIDLIAPYYVSKTNKLYYRSIGLGYSFDLN